MPRTSQNHLNAFYSHIQGFLQPVLYQKIKNSKVLIIGTGGIGCELLKSMVLGGFSHFTVIDLDTIEVSNLNRQFFFRRHHVGQPKATVAAQCVAKINPLIHIKPHFASVISVDFGPLFVKQFDVVLNALDNIPARNYVNRVCYASNIPLIESGTAGYQGQVTPISFGQTECYECHPKPSPKTFPVCTIRSNPSMPVHCLVWAKALFQTLFGTDESDDSEPDTSVESDDHEDDESSLNKQEIPIETTNQIPIPSINYETCTVFEFLSYILLHEFSTKISNLISINGDTKWKNQSNSPPRPLHTKIIQINPLIVEIDSVETKFPEFDKSLQTSRTTIPTLHQDIAQFLNSAATLFKKRYKGQKEFQEFDKDDLLTMKFVHSAANLRSYIFHIPAISFFTAQSISGNIIPAIATSNSVIASLMVLETIKILNNQKQKIVHVYLNSVPTQGKLIFPVSPSRPNPNCYICQKQSLYVNIIPEKMLLRTFINLVLKGNLHFSQPAIIWNSVILFEDGEDAEDYVDLLDKTLGSFGISENSILSVEDFAQSIDMQVVIGRYIFEDDQDVESDVAFSISLQDVSKQKVQPSPLKKRKT